MRVQLWLARAGIAARRKAEELIRAGRVTVNGEPCVLGMRITPGRDRVLVDGHPVLEQQEKVYFLWNKPRGVVTTMHDPPGRKSLADYVAHLNTRVFPVGRLDRDSEGLIILTNDGLFTHHLQHPRYGAVKTYQVTIDGHLSHQELQRLVQGIELEDGPARPEDVEVVAVEGDRMRLRIALKEGRNREIRRLMEVLGHPVLRLRRIAIGTLEDRALPVGAMRALTAVEIQRLTTREKGSGTREPTKEQPLAPLRGDRHGHRPAHRERGIPRR